MRNVGPAKGMEREGDYKEQIYDRNKSFLFPSRPRRESPTSLFISLR
jgi:hypothetical protein